MKRQRNRVKRFFPAACKRPSNLPGAGQGAALLPPGEVGDLHGRLLILHGLMDDNVHVQNTAQLVNALQRADKDFEMMLYPRARHGIFSKHFRRLTLDFMQRTLRPQP